MASRVIILGATNGSFTPAFTKLATLHSKNSFTLCLLLGDLFSSPSSSTPEQDEDVQRLLRGEITVPLPTYFGLGQHPLPAPVLEKISQTSGEVCENLFFLGKKGILTTSDGIRIVALGGRLDATLTGTSKGEDAEAAAPFYSELDARGLKGANYADLLITYEWPEGVQNGSANAPKETPVGVSKPIADLTAALRPRYHLCPGVEEFWEREPYRNSLRHREGAEDVKVTRVLAVGDWGNEKKTKALYAFVINVKEPTPVTANMTPPPFTEDWRGKKRGREDADGSESFFWGDHSGSGRDHRGGKRGRGRGGRGRREERPPPGPESCFFCLSYTQLEKHLIVSIGDEAYLTTAKGPLTNSTSNPETLPFSSHILIIPLTHAPTIQEIDPETRSSTMQEMTNYRLAIERMLNARKCGAVTFEVSRASGVHVHWQVIPVPLEKLDAVEEAFKTEAAADSLGALEKREVAEDAKGDHFRVWISGVEGGYVIALPGGQYFDLQFGRRVVAKLLGLKKIHWMDCVQTVEEEVEDAGAFKEAFKEFDFSL